MRPPRAPSSFPRLLLACAWLLAAALTAGACRETPPAATGLRVVPKWTEGEIDQLEFTLVDDEGEVVVGPETRPKVPGGTLRSGADVYIYVREDRANRPITCQVRGLSNRGATLSGSGTATLAAGEITRLDVSLAPGAIGPIGSGRANGQPCTRGAECTTGVCADGVCCDKACAGTCQACNLKGKAGTCSPVAAGEKHRACMDQGATSCGLDGTCDGKGGCRKYPAGTRCANGSCTGSTIIGVAICNGEGGCVAAEPVSCVPFKCDPTSQPARCLARCAADGDCVSERRCVGGSCGKKPVGASCLADAECDEDKRCVDGFCCENECEGACQSCNQVGAQGMCRPIAAGVKDPRGLCEEQPKETCGTTGTCDGKGACEKHQAGTICKDSSCVGDAIELSAAKCDGQGTCQVQSRLACAPYKCTNGACIARCGSTNDCIAPRVCDASGSCGRKGLGLACSTPGQCESGFCVDGVCCNEPCSGACRTCSAGATPGKCSLVGAGSADPSGICKDNGPSLCGTDGKCDGTGRCRRYAVGTVCGSGSCTGSTRTIAPKCDSTGRCVSGPQVSCSPFQCSGTVCASTCTTDGNCVAPNVCIGGTCGLRGSGGPCTRTAECNSPLQCVGGICQLKPLGAICTAGNQCNSGSCTDGVCCEKADCGTCRGCRVSGTVGYCAPLPAGTQEPRQRCAVEPAASCGRDGTCDGAGACRLYPSGTQCGAPSCSGGIRENPDTCDGAGVCLDRGTTDCGSYLCDATTNACFSSCTDNTQCARGKCRDNACMGGS